LRPTPGRSQAADPGVWTCSGQEAVSPNPMATSFAGNHPCHGLWRFCSSWRRSRAGFYAPGLGMRGVFPRFPVSHPPAPGNFYNGRIFLFCDTCIAYFKPQLSILSLGVVCMAISGYVEVAVEINASIFARYPVNSHYVYVW